MHTYRLPIRPKLLAEVADRFHLAPLIRTITSPLEIFVLAISEGGARLLQVVVNMPPARVPVPHLSDDPAETLDRPSIHVRAPRRRLQNLEGEKILEAQYARKVDRAVREALAGRSTPMVLAAAEPMATIFREVNTYPHLIEEVIEGSPDHRSDAQLGDAALPILDRLYRNEVKGILALYDELKPYRATSDVSHAAHAATAAAVGRLVVDLDRVIPGLVSDIDGSVTYSVSDDAETYSVLDEVARRALCTDARVLCARSEELPAGRALGRSCVTLSEAPRRSGARRASLLRTPSHSSGCGDPVLPHARVGRRAVRPFQTADHKVEPPRQLRCRAGGWPPETAPSRRRLQSGPLFRTPEASS
jgi:hypothetical protein